MMNCNCNAREAWQLDSCSWLPGGNMPMFACVLTSARQHKIPFHKNYHHHYNINNTK
jgi:hypothetical protein